MNNAQPNHSASKTTGLKSRRLIKGRCQECSFYHHCPRMNGKNICFGKKEVLDLPESSKE